MSGRRSGSQRHRPEGEPFAPRDGCIVVGHRGAAGVAPENTVPAIEHARRVGADAVEVDLRDTSDGRLVLLHDETLDRTTDGAGPVAERPLAEVRRLDAGHAFTPDRGRRHPYRGRGVAIPTLEEALEAAAPLPVVAEVKSGRAGELLSEWLASERGTAEARRLLVGGFSLEAMEDAAGRCRWRCASESELRPYVLSGKLGLRRPFVPDADALMVPERRGLLPIVTRRFVEGAHEDGLGVHVWTVNRPGPMRRLLDRGVDGLVTDFPARARRVLDERAAPGAAGPP